MKFRSGIFMLVVFAACLIATESESNAQLLRRGGLATNIARSQIVRASPALRIGQFARSGAQRTNQFGSPQGFRGGPQFGNGNGFNASRLIRVGRIISRF